MQSITSWGRGVRLFPDAMPNVAVCLFIWVYHNSFQPSVDIVRNPSDVLCVYSVGTFEFFDDGGAQWHIAGPMT